MVRSTIEVYHRGAKLGSLILNRFGVYAHGSGYTKYKLADVLTDCGEGICHRGYSQVVWPPMTVMYHR